jgi:thiamine-phosphate pyrophosphorylase
MLIYYITDRRQFGGRRDEQERKLLEKIRECAAAGVDYIQLREKDLSTRELERLGEKAMAAIPIGSSAKLLINSRIDVALACGAHGVHLPGNYLSPSDARAIFVQAGQSRPVIAVSTHSIIEVAAAESHGATFAVFGPVFEKNAVRNRAGLPQLAALAERPECATPAMPIVALGGIGLENAAECLAAGAAGIAAIRLFQQNDVAATVKILRRLGTTQTVAGA